MTKKVKLTKFEAELTRTEAQFAANSTVYPANIVCITDGGDNDGKVKVTDGVSSWSDLAYEADGAEGDGVGISSINLNVGPAIELRIPLDAMWAQVNNAGSPAAGEFEASSNNDASAVTSFTFHSTDAGGNDQTAFFTSMRIGGLLTGRQTNNDGTNASGSPCVYRVTAVPTLASSQYTIAVAYVSGQFIGSFPNWYVSYAGNEQTQYYNGTAVQLQEAIITGLTDASGRLNIDMSGAPYGWTNIRYASWGSLDGAATQGFFTALSANTAGIDFFDQTGSAYAPEGTPVWVRLEGA